MISQSDLSKLIVLLSFVIAFGGPTFLFFSRIYSKPQLMALFLLSALTSLAGFFLASVCWGILNSFIALKYIALIGTLLQECCRFSMIRYIYRDIEVVYNKSFANSRLSAKSASIFKLKDLSSSLTAGVGFGLMKSLMIFGNMFSKRLQSDHSDLSSNILIKSHYVPELLGMSIFSASFFLLDLLLMPLSFMAEKKSDVKLTVCVILLRLLSTASVFLVCVENGFIYSLGGIFFICCLSAGILRNILPSLLRSSSS